MAEPDAIDRIGVVVVEDEALIRTELVEAFSHHEFHAIGAENAAAALEILQQEAQRVQVVFTDMHLPGPMKGLALGHEVRKRWPWISLLVTSGYGTPDPAHMPQGGRFILKPYKIGKIAEQIRDMVQAAKVPPTL